jgi:hypothetical protein
MPLVWVCDKLILERLEQLPSPFSSDYCSGLPTSHNQLASIYIRTNFVFAQGQKFGGFAFSHPLFYVVVLP